MGVENSVVILYGWLGLKHETTLGRPHQSWNVIHHELLEVVVLGRLLLDLVLRDGLMSSKHS